MLQKLCFAGAKLNNKFKVQANPFKIYFLWLNYLTQASAITTSPHAPSLPKTSIRTLLGIFNSA